MGKRKGLPTFEGHRRGFEVLQKVAEYLRKINVRVMTVWAFSTENWNRDSKEVAYLMDIYEKMARSKSKNSTKRQYQNSSSW